MDICEICIWRCSSRWVVIKLTRGIRSSYPWQGLCSPNLPTLCRLKSQIFPLMLPPGSNSTSSLNEPRKAGNKVYSFMHKTWSSFLWNLSWEVSKAQWVPNFKYSTVYLSSQLRKTGGKVWSLLHKTCWSSLDCPTQISHGKTLLAQSVPNCKYPTVYLNLLKLSGPFASFWKWQAPRHFLLCTGHPPYEEIIGHQGND